MLSTLYILSHLIPKQLDELDSPRPHFINREVMVQDHTAELTDLGFKSVI